MSAKRCFSAWYDADAAAERHAVLGVLQGEVEDAVDRTDGLGVLQHQRHLELALDVGGGVADRAHDGRRGDHGAVELEVGEPPRHVERLRADARSRPASVGGNQELGEALAGARGHEPGVGDARVLDVRLGAREHPALVVRGGA